MTATPWDDERLAVAYGAMAGACAVPPDLVPSVAAALAGPRRSPSIRPRLVAAAALVVAVIAVVGGGILGYQAVRPATPSATSPAIGHATGSPTSPGPSEPGGTTVPSNPPLAIPVISVGDAVGVRDGGVDGRDIAVRGWYQNGGPVPCPWDPSIVNALQPRCPDDRVWLTRDPETLFVKLPNGGETMPQPTGPALHPLLDQVAPWTGLPPVSGVPQPVELVMVGHFDDPLAATCPTDARQACRDRFVVTQVWTPDGGTLLDRAPDDASVIPAISVSDAIQVRENGVDRNEIAVRGWYSANPPTPCMVRHGPIVIDPLQTTCFDEYVWLLKDPERLPLVDAESAVAPQPAGPGFHPYLGRLDRSWVADPITSGQGVLLDVVMVGHFDDTEAATCPKPSREACRDRFVVDQVWSGDRADLLSSTTEP